MLIAMGAWIGPKGDRLTMHAWTTECINELVDLLTQTRTNDSGGIVIDVERRVADREFAGRMEIHESRATKNAARTVMEERLTGVWAPGRPPIGNAGRYSPVNRVAARVMSPPKEEPPHV